MNFTTAPERSAKHIGFLVLGDTQSFKEVSIDLIEKAMYKFGNTIDFVIATLLQISTHLLVTAVVEGDFILPRA